MTPFRQSRADLPPLDSVAGRRRANIPLESLNLPAPSEINTDPPDDIQLAADLLGRILAYSTQTLNAPTMGRRLFAIVHVLRPDLLDGVTLEAFAAQDRTTRQSIEHYISEFRKTFDI